VSRQGAYKGRHKTVRKVLAPDAIGRPCPLCGLPMLPGQDLDLDHLPGTDTYRGMAHAACNRRDGALRGNRARRQQGRRAMDNASTVALGVEVSQDRQHTSIGAAGALEGDLVLIELAAYSDGTATAVERVVELAERWHVVAVVIDPMGGATNLRKPLREHRGVHLIEPATADVKTAHADFCDLFASHRVKHARQPELDAAIRHLAERTLGGMPVFNRRGAPVDVSPAVACELACFGLLSVPRLPAPDIF